MSRVSNYFAMLGRNRRKAEIYSLLDSLPVGGTCVVTPESDQKETERTMHGMRSYWQSRRDGKLRFHRIALGFMFVRIE